jgi:hypothetical protein
MDEKSFFFVKLIDFSFIQMPQIGTIINTGLNDYDLVFNNCGSSIERDKFIHLNNPSSFWNKFPSIWMKFTTVLMGG